MSKISKIEERAINAARFLSAEAIQKANSGHPGLPLGFAPSVYRLFSSYMKHSPKNPNWVNRDRFVLSAGHGSALLYSLLHLTGYGLSMDDLKNFRQLGSKTPGHPEYGHTTGVEITTGPLGQGIATSVGMAIAQKHLASRFNTADFDVVDYNVWVVVGDGCLQEGVSSEACSLAGHLQLDNLVVLYDDNNITIDGPTSLSFGEDVVKRFEAYGWHCQEIKGDGNDVASLDEAVAEARKQNKPCLIKMQSIIGFGAPNKQGSSSVHGSPLGDDEIALAKKNLDYDGGTFEVPADVTAHYAEVTERLNSEESDWNATFEKYKAANPELAAEFEAAVAGVLPAGLFDGLEFEAGTKVATRVASGKTLNHIMPKALNFFGGSADLSPSNNTRFTDSVAFSKDNHAGRYIHYGIREHAMGCIINGIGLSGMMRAYGATFLSFSDYMLPSLRVAALSKYPSIFVFTHDSIGLGEDGPTHQPVEQVGYLRAMPELISFRPADAYETKEAWNFALNHTSGPVVMSFTRQGLPVFDQATMGKATGVHKGGYVLSDQENFTVLLLATGSEVSLALEAQEILGKEGIASRVVSLPSVELFEAQTQDYQDGVIPPSCAKRVVVEAGIKRGWEGYMGPQGKFIGMDGFGASAPAGELYKHFGITVEKVVAAAKS
ncbi:MAG: transketolase [SAR324 cluster bacterium]|nr:transketolase [SAR324 cluster bacterium]